MRIVIPALSLELGGGARFLYQLGNGLVDKGHSVEFVMPDSGAVAWPVKAKIRRVKALTPASIPTADFILPNFYPTVFPAWQSNKGQVVRLSLVYEPLCLPNAGVSKQTYLIGVPIISISDWQRKLILKETGLNSTVVHPGVDMALFHPQPKSSAQTGRKSVFYIARGPGYSWKGNADFIDAYRRIKQVLPTLDLQVVLPEGAPFESSIPYVTKSAYTDQEMAYLYAQADLYVYASYFEAFGLPPLEAMACGTAVVTTDCGGNRDYARNGENCLVVPPSDVDQLTEAMKRLLLNDAERLRLANAGLNSAKTWAWQRTTDQVEACLFAILKGKRS